MRKIIIALIVVICCLCMLYVLFIANVDKMLDKYSQEAILQIKNRPIKGVVVNTLHYKEAMLETLTLASWKKIDANLTLKTQSDMLASSSFDVQVDCLKLELKDFAKRELQLSAEGLFIHSEKANGDHKNSLGTISQFEEGRFYSTFHLDFLKPSRAISQLKEYLNALSQLAKTGTSQFPIELSGIIKFNIGDEPVKAKIYSEHNRNTYYIRIDEASLRLMSWLFGEKLTEPEIVLIAKNPFKAPDLLRIKNEAQTTSEREHQKNAIVPEDAYRHVLWSYLLTLKYGPEVAKAITDAHELGITDNTEAEHRMDYQNNSVGREYALKGLKKKAVLLTLLSDPKVVRQSE